MHVSVFVLSLCEMVWMDFCGLLRRAVRLCKE